MTFLTLGFWLIIWAIAGMNASGANHQERKRYETEKAQYALDYDAWQLRYHQAYGGPPPARV